MKNTEEVGPQPSKGCVPSTHLLGAHLAPAVDDAGLPAAVPQQVLPQVAARLFKALASEQEQHYNHRKNKSSMQGGKALVRKQHPLLRPLASLWEQERDREMGTSLAQKSQCPPAARKHNHQ